MIDKCGQSQIQSTPDQQVTSNCNFDDGSGNRRRLQNQPTTESCAKTSVLHYVNGMASSPAIAAANMELIKSLAESQTNSKFDEYSYLPPQTPGTGLTRFIDTYGNPNSLSRFDLLRIMLDLMNDLPRQAPPGLSAS